MPCMDGFDVLTWMRKHPEYAVTPTTVFSSSDSPEDIRLAYELGANAYMVKPSQFEELRQMLGAACQFWFLRHTACTSRRDTGRRLLTNIARMAVAPRRTLSTALTNRAALVIKRHARVLS